MGDGQEKIIQRITVYDPLNPDYVDSGTRTMLTVVNGDHLSVTCDNDDDQSGFVMGVTDPIHLGLRRFEDPDIFKFTDDVVMASNLVLDRVLFSKFDVSLHHPILSRKTMPVEITDSVSSVLGLHAKLNEKDVIDVLGKLQKVDGEDIDMDLQVQDLQKSLMAFQMTSACFNRLIIFKNLFTSMELAINCDGGDRSGTGLDDAIKIIGKISSSDVEDIRTLNNRLKHANRNEQHEIEFGKLKPKMDIFKLITATRNAIRHRLNQIS